MVKVLLKGYSLLALLRQLTPPMRSSSHGASARRQKCINSAAERNKEPILEVLKQYIAPPDGLPQRTDVRLLEISSGSGQHVVHLAPHFPWVTFQPSEVDEVCMASIASYVEDSGLRNVKAPIFLDVTQSHRVWDGGRIPERSLDYVLNINMMHISPIACTRGLFRNCGLALRPAGLLFTYGPYAFDGVISPDSNVRFDAMLRQEDPEWGLRDRRDLVELAKQHGISLLNTHALPANNHLLVWQKDPQA